MALEYAGHATRRMAQRRVSHAEVELVLANFVQSRRSQDHPGCFIYTAFPGGRKVVVEVEEGTNPLVVVTVWADRRR
jgi:hypothetical protein